MSLFHKLMASNVWFKTPSAQRFGSQLRHGRSSAECYNLESTAVNNILGSLVRGPPSESRVGQTLPGICTISSVLTYRGVPDGAPPPTHTDTQPFVLPSTTGSGEAFQIPNSQGPKPGVPDAKGKSKAPEAAHPSFMPITPSTSCRSPRPSGGAPGVAGAWSAVSSGSARTYVPTSEVARVQEAGFIDAFPRPVSPEAPSAPSVFIDRTAGCPQESTLQKATTAVRTKELYHWCATVGVLLLLQLVSDSLGHPFRWILRPSDWCGLLLLVLSLAAVVTLRVAPSTRRYAARFLAIGSLIVTCQIACRGHSSAMRVRGTISLQHPFLSNMSSISNSTAAGSQLGATQSTPPSLYGMLLDVTGLNVLDNATFFVVLFLNCLQSSFLCSLGIKITATVSVLQWIVLICWPLTSAPQHASWVCCIVTAGLWTAHLICSSYVWESELQDQSQVIDELWQLLAESRKELKDGQTADSVLNHMLNNNMADASGCIDVYLHKKAFDEEDKQLLTKASDTLFRAMWCCKMREAILSMVSGSYEPQACEVNLLQFRDDFVRGRDVVLDCPVQVLAHLDPTICNVILENAVTNAMRHGCPQEPQVRLTVQTEVPPDVLECTHPRHAMLDASSDPPTPVKVRFLIVKRADPRRPALVPWSTQQLPAPLPVSRSRPVLSDGLGLAHIHMVANTTDMVAELWQEGEECFFELSFMTTASSIASSPTLTQLPEQPPACPLCRGLHIIALEDSGIPRKSLLVNLENAIPDATIAMYGKDIDEVEEFRQAALDKADIVILDQNIDVPGNHLEGSAILNELIGAGYDGFACIQSGNSALADQALSLRSGAHWHVGKGVPMPEMIRLLKEEFQAFRLNRQQDEAPGQGTTDSQPPGAAGLQPSTNVHAWSGSGSGIPTISSAVGASHERLAGKA